MFWWPFILSPPPTPKKNCFGLGIRFRSGLGFRCFRFVMFTTRASDLCADTMKHLLTCNFMGYN